MAKDKKKKKGKKKKKTKRRRARRSKSTAAKQLFFDRISRMNKASIRALNSETEAYT